VETAQGVKAPGKTQKALNWAFGGDRKWFVLAIALATADAAAGFILSFNNLGAAGREHGFHPWWMLPVLVDLGIPIYVLADHWLVAHGHRSVLARGAVWAFAAATVVLNGAVSTDPEAFWRWAHMLAPAAWILGVEVIRRMWKAYRKGRQPQPDRVPLARWIAAPLRTPHLWRRKHQLSVTWTAMLALEDARLFVEALADAARRARPDTPLPSAIERVVKECRFPAHLATKVTSVEPMEWEPVLIEWVGLQMALPDVLRAAVSAATPDPLPEPPAVTPLPEGSPDRLPGGDPDPSRILAPDPLTGDAQPPSGGGHRNPLTAPSRTPRPDPSRDSRRGRDMTAEEIAVFVREHLPVVPVPSINQIFDLGRAKLSGGYGRDKAREAHQILERSRVSLAAGGERGGR